MAWKPDDLRQYLMDARPDWNRRGPHVPHWFRSRLRRIDRNLRLQFMPPAEPTEIESGVDKRLFPKGLWVICRRLPRTRMLFKQTTFHLGQFGGAATEFATHGTLRMLRYVNRLWRRNKLDVVARDIDRICSDMTQQREKSSREELRSHLIKRFRKLDLSKKKMGVPIASMRTGV